MCVFFKPYKGWLDMALKIFATRAGRKLQRGKIKWLRIKLMTGIDLGVAAVELAVIEWFRMIVHLRETFQCSFTYECTAHHSLQMHRVTMNHKYIEHHTIGTAQESRNACFSKCQTVHLNLSMSFMWIIKLWAQRALKLQYVLVASVGETHCTLSHIKMPVGNIFSGRLISGLNRLPWTHQINLPYFKTMRHSSCCGTICVTLSL